MHEINTQSEISVFDMSVCCILNYSATVCENVSKSFLRFAQIVQAFA